MKTITLKGWVVEHPILKGIGVSLAKCGIWLTLWNRTFVLQWNDGSGFECFSAGFGYCRSWYMEIGNTSFDVRKDGKLTVGA